MIEIKFKPLLGIEEKKNLNKVIDSGILAHGNKVVEFENLFTKFTKSRDSIAVSSCTAGMHLFYFVLGIRKGDEVIVPAQTHTATAHAVELVGAKAVFVDCELETGNIDLSLIKKKINKNTKAICVAHFVGIPTNMIQLMKLAKKYNLKVIEDCATALGAKIKNKHVGLYGDAGVFSFYPVKHITSAEGGMIILKNKNLSKKLRLARAFGIDKGHLDRNTPGAYECVSLGFNYRMSEVHAAIGISQIKKFSKFLKIRRRNYNYLKKLIRPIENIYLVEPRSKFLKNSYYCFQILLKNKISKLRNDLIKFFKNNNINTSIYYPKPVPNMKYYKNKYKVCKGEFYNSETISNHSISIPIHSGITFKNLKHISNNLKKFISKK